MGQFKPGRGNQTLIISPWISILHHPLLCKRFVSDEVTLIYNIHHQCVSYLFMYPLYSFIALQNISLMKSVIQNMRMHF